MSKSITTSNIISLSITNRHSPTRKVFIIVVWRQMPKLTALLQCCIATSLHPKSVQTESTLRYFAASLQSMPGWKQDTYQSMPAWTQDPSRCFVASLQSYIRCQSELKAAPATSLLRCFVTIYASLNTRHLSLLRCFAAILYKMPVRTEGSLRCFVTIYASLKTRTSRCFVCVGRLGYRNESGTTSWPFLSF